MKLNIQNCSKLITLTLALLSLSSCAVYSKGFDCTDSKGMPCTMLSSVDKMVDSGEIETVYLERQRKNCQGKNCNNKNSQLANQPKLMMNKIHKVKIQSPDLFDEYQDGDNLYLKQ